MIAFVLWRESRLSIAEIYNFFWKKNCIYANMEIAIFEDIKSEDVITNFHKLWWSIKAIEIVSKIQNLKEFTTWTIKLISEIASDYDWKFNFWLASYWKQINIFTLWIQVKKELKKEIETNLRFVNKDNNNVNAATYKREKLNSSWVEINYISTAECDYIWETIIFQDVDEYSKRDYWKDRDMNIWMLPPKLAQIMINIAWNSNSIYDPFCWLWTVLIEAANSWIQNINWSDINPDMVSASRWNIKRYFKEWMHINIFKQDATKIHSLWNDIQNINIISEWFLWSIMTKWHVTPEKINEERKNLANLYDKFFFSLNKIRYKWTIVMCFPFWQFKWKYIYFEEVYKIFKKYSITPQKMLPENIDMKETRSWSILYHRPNQQVWREIFLLKNL